MEEETIILLAQEMARQQQPILTKLSSINDTLEKLPFKTNRSLTVTINLPRARIDEPLNAKYSGRTYLWLTIERVDNAFTYQLGQLGDTKSEPFTAAVGASLFLHEFTEVYITNAAALGIGVILLGWRE